MPYSTLMPVFADVVLKNSAKPVVSFICEGQHRLFTCQAPEALPLGMLLTAVGVGAVIGALMVASLPEDSRRGSWLTLGNLGFPLTLLLLAIFPSFIFAMIMLMLVGLQGAGKSTTLRIMAGLLSADGGQANVLGQNAWSNAVALRRRVAYLPEKPRYYDWMTVAELGWFTSGFQNRDLDCRTEIDRC